MPAPTDFNTLILHSRILLVDDNAINLSVLEAMLRKASYCEIDCCTDPFEVRERYRQQRPDVVLLDIHMPGLSGLEVLTQLAEDHPGGWLPVVMLTADTAPDLRRKALSSGARDYITKPFDKAEVLLRVNNILLVQALHRQLQDLQQQLAACQEQCPSWPA